MTITLTRPGNEILLNAATAPARAAMHTSRIAARNLRHNSLFALTPDGRLHRAQGTPTRCTYDGKPAVTVITLADDGLLGVLTFGINESVHGVVGAI